MTEYINMISLLYEESSWDFDIELLYEEIGTILIYAERMYRKVRVRISIVKSRDKCCDLSIFTIDTMEHRNNEIKSWMIFEMIPEIFGREVFCNIDSRVLLDEPVNITREIKYFRSMSSNFAPILHIRSASQRHFTFSRDATSEDCYMHVDTIRYAECYE